MMTAKEYWERYFGEHPKSDADKLAVTMMTQYAIYIKQELKIGEDNGI